MVKNIPRDIDNSLKTIDSPMSRSSGSSGSSKKMIESFKDETKKVTSRGLKNIFNVIGRKIFSKVYRNEVDYGQTLSKKRRKNCILKSVSSLSGSETDRGVFVHSPYHINFQFSRDEPHFRGSVLNFQKIDLEDACCEKCMGSLKKGDAFSRFSISSDSACDVSSESSCEDEDCKYRRSVSKSKAKFRKTRSKSSGDVYGKGLSTVENFIRIHNETFKTGAEDPVCDFLTVSENFQNALIEWTEEDQLRPAVSSPDEPKPVEDSDYDILVTRSGYRVLEPSYENLKLVENFYETPNRKELTEDCSDGEPPEKPKDVVHCSKTYDEVIESLKLWHLSSRYPEEGGACSCCDNNLNHCLENYETLENDFNNDIEEFSC